MKKIFLTLTLAVGIMASAQVRIGGTGTSVDANAILEVQSSTKGLLFPKVALTGTANVAPLSAHVAGMTVYNTATAGDVTPGLYANSGTAWVSLSSSANSALNVTAEQTGSYTALATDDIILMTPGPAATLTLPTSGISIGKKYYVSIKGANNVALSPTPRDEANNSLQPTYGHTLIYVGGTGAGSWSVVSGF